MVLAIHCVYEPYNIGYIQIYFTHFWFKQEKQIITINLRQIALKFIGNYLKVKNSRIVIRNLQKCASS